MTNAYPLPHPHGNITPPSSHTHPYSYTLFTPPPSLTLFTHPLHTPYSLTLFTYPPHTPSSLTLFTYPLHTPSSHTVQSLPPLELLLKKRTGTSITVYWTVDTPNEDVDIEDHPTLSLLASIPAPPIYEISYRIAGGGDVTLLLLYPLYSPLPLPLVLFLTSSLPLTYPTSLSPPSTSTSTSSTPLLPYP